MNWNYEKLFIAKETTPWVAVVWTNVYPVISNSIDTICEIEKIEQIEWNMYWPTRSVQWKKKVWWNIDTYLYPSMAWFAMNSILWDATTTDNWNWTYTHEFDYTNNVTPSYTIESTKWNHVVRTSWNKVNTFWISIDWTKYKSSLEIVWQYWTSLWRITNYDSNSWDLTLLDETFLTTNDTIDIYDHNWSLIYWGEAISAVNWKIITIANNLTIAWWSSLTLVKRNWILKDEFPFQFLAKTNVQIDWNTSPIRSLSLKMTNNIDTEAWFQSWSQYTQLVNTKLRNITWSMTLDTEYAISLLTTYNGSEEFQLTIVMEDREWNNIEIQWLAIIDSSSTEISSNTDITTPVEFSFDSFNYIKTTNTLATLD